MTAENKPNIVRVEATKEYTANRKDRYFKVHYDRTIVNSYLGNSNWRFVIGFDEISVWRKAQRTLDRVYGKD